jgi:hypothetical protein
MGTLTVSLPSFNMLMQGFVLLCYALLSLAGLTRGEEGSSDSEYPENLHIDLIFPSSSASETSSLCGLLN